jgi:hypothetical protein
MKYLIIAILLYSIPARGDTIGHVEATVVTNVATMTPDGTVTPPPASDPPQCATYDSLPMTSGDAQVGAPPLPAIEGSVYMCSF